MFLFSSARPHGTDPFHYGDIVEIKNKVEGKLE